MYVCEYVYIFNECMNVHMFQACTMYVRSNVRINVCSIYVYTNECM